MYVAELTNGLDFVALNASAMDSNIASSIPAFLMQTDFRLSPFDRKSPTSVT
jgi:hypothetical protein